MEEKKYPIGGYAPGSYQCHCGTCGGGFFGDKRAYQCIPCAVRDREKFDALSPAEQAKIIKRNVEAVNKVFKDWGKKPDVNLAIMGHGEPKKYPGSSYQNLFDYMTKEHGLTLLESEMNDLIRMVHKYHPAGEEAIAFAEWCSDNGVLHNKENIWYTWGFTKAIGDTGKMYELFKQQKEK